MLEKDEQAPICPMCKHDDVIEVAGYDQELGAFKKGDPWDWVTTDWVCKVCGLKFRTQIDFANKPNPFGFYKE